MQTLSNWKPFLTRLAVFLILVYGVVPTAIYSIGIHPQIKVNMLLTPVAILGTIAAFVIFKREELKKFSYTFSWKQALIFTILGYTQFVLYIFQQNTWLGYHYNIPFLILGGIYFFGGSLFIFLAVFQLNFFKHFLKSVLLSFATIFLYILFALFSQAIAGWPLTRIMTKTLAWLLSLTNKVTTNYDGIWPYLQADNFSAYIAPACTGVTSLVLFTGLYLLTVLLDWKKLNKTAIFWVYIGGIVGVFIMALLRLYLLFLIGGNWSSKFALAGFHTNAGWAFFVTFFLVYLWFAYPRMLRNQQRKL